MGKKQPLSSGTIIAWCSAASLLVFLVQVGVYDNGYLCSLMIWVEMFLFFLLNVFLSGYFKFEFGKALKISVIVYFIDRLVFPISFNFFSAFGEDGFHVALFGYLLAFVLFSWIPLLLSVGGILIGKLILIVFLSQSNKNE